MKKLTITIRVAAAAAVRAGKATLGDHGLVLEEADLASLTNDERETLARHVGGEPEWRDPLWVDAPPVAEATLATLRLLLQIRLRRQVVREAADLMIEADNRRAAGEIAAWLREAGHSEFADFVEQRVTRDRPLMADVAADLEPFLAAELRRVGYRTVPVPADSSFRVYLEAAWNLAAFKGERAASELLDQDVINLPVPCDVESVALKRPAREDEEGDEDDEVIDRHVLRWSFDVGSAEAELFTELHPVSKEAN